MPDKLGKKILIDTNIAIRAQPPRALSVSSMRVYPWTKKHCIKSK
jgi:hypothetical protein